MRSARDYTDIIGGLLLIAGGTWFMLYSTGYSIGSLRRMGPGYFPMVIGGLVLLFGVLVLLPGLFRAGQLPRPEWRPFLTISASILIFALIVEKFGLIPATVALTLVAAVADDRSRILPTVILAAALSAIAVGVFTQGLGIPIPAIRWSY